MNKKKLKKNAFLKKTAVLVFFQKKHIFLNKKHQIKKTFFLQH